MLKGATKVPKENLMMLGTSDLAARLQAWSLLPAVQQMPDASKLKDISSAQ
jgi:hypothetical protein